MTSRNKNLRAQRKGSAMVLSMFAVILLVVAGVGLLQVALGSRIFAIRSASAIGARSAADAGLVQALNEMNLKLQVKPWSDSVLPSASGEALPNCSGQYSYTVTGDQYEGYAAESTGRFTGVERTVRCQVPLLSPYEDLIRVAHSITIGNSSNIATFDSRIGNTVTSRARIGTIGTEADGAKITFGNSTVVNSDVYVGLNGEPDAVISGGTINGLTYALNEELPMEQMAAPAMADKGDMSVTSDLTIGPGNSGRYGTIAIDNNKTLTIRGGHVVVYVAGDITIRNNASIEVESGASMTIYIDGNIITGNNTDINNKTEIPSNFKLFSTGSAIQNFDLKNKADLYAVIYAPNANVTLKNGGDIYGAYTANNFETKNAATLFYDIALGVVTVNDDGVRFVIRYWSED